PGFGMGGPGASGELLIPFDPPFVFSGPPWTGAGNPVSFTLPIPNVPALFGFSAYVQGLMYDPTSAFGVTFGVTGAVELLIGP
ncbi:MAG: hypothetical protein O7B99_06530, partial [Planctomycetota bacterium]|nr:hypothetical protein [Planctomycetota bacterium]